jgi:periplasmic divalent cation tolerance protein
VTVPNKKAGQKIAEGLVESRLAACVNVLPAVDSFYRWKGKVEAASELLLVIKTQKDLVGALTTFVKENHPYEVCEVIALPVMEGNPAYLDWIGSSTNLSRPLKDRNPEDMEKEVG